MFNQKSMAMKRFFEKVSAWRWNVAAPWAEKNEDKIVRFLCALTYLLLVDVMFILTGLLMQVLPE